MPLSGGPADKIGNRYEQWWTVSQFVRIINGEVESIRIEDPTIDKAEFVITAGGCREFHQDKAKSYTGQVESIRTWKSQTSIITGDVQPAFWEQCAIRFCVE